MVTKISSQSWCVWRPMPPPGGMTAAWTKAKGEPEEKGAVSVVP